MKYILLFLSIFSLQALNAQKKSIQVSIPGKAIQVNLDEENPANVLSINSSSASIKTGKLKVVNHSWKTEKEWKRSFSIYNSTDAVVATITPCKISGNYEILLNKILPKMVKGETYTLYTMAIPRDPKKAAVVRVRRVLVCTINVQ